MRSKLALVGLSMTLATGCASTPPPAEAPAPGPSAAPVASGMLRPLTQAQLDVAHYKSTDGMHGFVLDRTGEKAKLRVDGETDIVELSKEEDRHGGELRGYWFVTPSGKRPVFISAGGSIHYYKGRDEFAMLSDKPADPLPAATVTGTYVAPPPAFQATIDRLAPIAVKTKLTQFKLEDAANLEKVKEAIAAAAPDMFVHYVSHGGAGAAAHLAVVPDQFHGISFGGVAYRTDEKWDPAAKAGLPKYGGKNKGFSEYGSMGNHMQVMHMQGYPPPLAENTPGLLWDLEGTRGTFVTLDGARYRIDLSEAHDKGPSLDSGAGAPASWPAPIQHPLLDVPDFSSLAKAGAVPQKAVDDLLALDEEWNVCAQKTWKDAERVIDSGKATENDRKDWLKRVEQACKKSVDKQEKMLVALIDARVSERMAVLEAAKAKLGKK